MLLVKSQKRQFTEDEAAEFLGISVEQLRRLVHRHILNEEDGCTAAPGLPAPPGLAVYQRSDLLVLRLLRTHQASA